MSINTDFPILDGIAPSFADLTCKVVGTGLQLLKMKDFKSINTSSAVDIGEQAGASGGRVMRRTTGSVKNEGSITLYHTGYTQLLRTLQAIAPKRGNEYLTALVHFNIIYQWAPPGSVEIFETRLLGCRCKGRTLNSAEGVEATEVEIPLSLGKLADVVDGKEYVYL